MPFSMPGDQKYLYKPESQYFIAPTLQIYKINTIAPKVSYFNGTLHLWILSDQFAAWHNDATAQQRLESSNQAFEKLNFLLKVFESENFSLHLWKY